MTPDPPLVRSLRWIRAHRRQPDGTRWSWRALSAAAGLTHSHVGNIVAGHQSASITLATAEALARAADVDRDWLLTHDGAPGRYAPQRPEPRVDSVAARPAVLEAGRSLGIDEAALAALEADRFAGAEPTASELYDRLLLHAREVRRLRAAIADPEPPESGELFRKPE